MRQRHGAHEARHRRQREWPPIRWDWVVIALLTLNVLLLIWIEQR